MCLTAKEKADKIAKANEEKANKLTKEKAAPVAEEKADKIAKTKEDKVSKSTKDKVAPVADEKSEKITKAKEDKVEKATKSKEDKENLAKEKSEKVTNEKQVIVNKTDSGAADKKNEVLKETTKAKEEKSTATAPQRKEVEVAKEPVQKSVKTPSANLPKGSAAAEGAAARAKIGDLKPGPNDLDKNGKQLTSQQMKMKECSGLGKGRNQADFRAFMSECLKND